MNISALIPVLCVFVCTSAIAQEPSLDCADPDRDDDGYLDVRCGGGDCNDGDPYSHPGATETCDRVDEDCDGVTDEEPECAQVVGPAGCQTAPNDFFPLGVLVAATLIIMTKRRRA